MTARYETIARWANEHNWRLGVEIGVFDARTHFYLLERCPQLTMMGVDVWDLVPGFSEGPTKSGERCRCPYCDETRAARRRETQPQMRERVLAQAGGLWKGRTSMYVGPSVEAALQVLPGTLDFVFVDGDHSEEGVSSDIIAWRTRLTPVGWMIGHDYNMQSVRSAVRANFDIDRVHVGDDHLWWVEGAAR